MSDLNKLLMADLIAGTFHRVKEGFREREREAEEAAAQRLAISKKSLADAQAAEAKAKRELKAAQARLAARQQLGFLMPLEDAIVRGEITPVDDAVHFKTQRDALLEELLRLAPDHPLQDKFVLDLLGQVGVRNFSRRVDPMQGWKDRAYLHQNDVENAVKIGRRRQAQGETHLPIALPRETEKAKK